MNCSPRCRWKPRSRSGDPRGVVMTGAGPPVADPDSRPASVLCSKQAFTR